MKYGATARRQLGPEWMKIILGVTWVKWYWKWNNGNGSWLMEDRQAFAIWDI